MKKILIVMLSVSFLFACNDNQGKNGILGGMGEKKTNRDKDKDDDNRRNTKDDDYNSKDDDDRGGGWTSTDKNNWMQVCKDGGISREICSCMLGKMERKYKNLADADERGGHEAGRELSMQCMNEGNGGNMDNNGGDDDRFTNDRNDDRSGDGWTNAQRKQWIKVCVTSVENEGVDSRRAENICSCVQEKMEKENPDYEGSNRTSQSELKQMTLDCDGMNN